MISNAASGANLEHGLEPVHALAAGAGLAYRSVSAIGELAGVLQECARRDHRLLLINAGDGTVTRILEHLRNDRWFEREPELALLRGGTTNMIHNDVGVPGRPAAGLRTLIDALECERCTRRERHVLRVSEATRAAPRFGFFLGTNAALKAILRTRERLHGRVSTGRFSEGLSLAAVIWRLWRRRVEGDPVLDPVPVELSRDGGPWQPCTHIALLVLSLHRALLGIRPLGSGQRAGFALLDWPGYRLAPWLRRFVTGGLAPFDTLSVRGTFGWVLDGEVHHHRAGDGALDVEVDAPARFVVPGG